MLNEIILAAALAPSPISAGSPSAATNPVVLGASKPDMVLKECMDTVAYEHPRGGDWLTPIGAVRAYWSERYGKILRLLNSKTTVLEPPQHGTITGPEITSDDTLDDKKQYVRDNFKGTFHYRPNPGFLGNDQVTFLVEVAGQKVKVITKLIVQKEVNDNHPKCPSGVKRLSAFTLPSPASLG